MADDGAAHAGAEAKDEKPNLDVITIRVRDQAGQETAFRVKRSTKFTKVFEAYAQRKGLTTTSLRFMLDGQRVGEHDSPDSLDLEDNDQIDALLFQEGGFRC